MSIPRGKSGNQGFTLVELMVVVVLIGILAATAVVGVNLLLGRTRDNVRKATLTLLQGALTSFYIENGRYPISGVTTWFSSEPNDRHGYSNNGGNWIPGLAPRYIAALPRDPRKGGFSKEPPCITGNLWPAYVYRSDNGTSYKLISLCSKESSKAIPTNDPFYDSARGNIAWMVCSGPPGCQF